MENKRKAKGSEVEGLDDLEKCSWILSSFRCCLRHVSLYLQNTKSDKQHGVAFVLLLRRLRRLLFKHFSQKTFRSRFNVFLRASFA